jgi:hypothetical protein
MPMVPQVECDGSDVGVKICEGSPARQSFRMVNEREGFFSHISTVGTEQDNEETAPLSPEWLQHDSPEKVRGGSKDFSSILLEDEYSNAALNLEDMKCELDSALRLSGFLTRRLNACHSGLIKVYACALLRQETLVVCSSSRPGRLVWSKLPGANFASETVLLLTSIMH